eukprot:scaffold65296_cov93-Phaeocystis_antarctica.AAC.1
MQVYSMGVGRSSIKITHGRLSSRHLCQLPPPALEGAWVKVEEIIGRGGAATRRSKSLLVTSVELALLAVLYVPTITLTPKTMCHTTPTNRERISPRDARRDRRPAPPPSRSHYLGERDEMRAPEFSTASRV